MQEYKTEFRKWCAENGHTAQTVADNLGISKETVQSYMIGRRYPARRVQKKFEEVYGVDAREVFPL